MVDVIEAPNGKADQLVPGVIVSVVAPHEPIGVPVCDDLLYALSASLIARIGRQQAAAKLRRFADAIDRAHR